MLHTETATAYTRSMHVLIAGGGLSGLCLAQGLRRHGHTAEVFERDPDHRRRTGSMLHMNAFGGQGLRTCLPDDLFELYLETSRETPSRRESIVLDARLNELSSQPHLGPPNDGDRPHTGVDRRTLRQILLSGLDVQLGAPVTGYVEEGSRVRVVLADGRGAEGDVLVGADGIRSAVRAHRLPDVRVIEAGVDGIGVFGRSVLRDADVPELLQQGVIIVTDLRGDRLLLGSFRPRREIVAAGAAAGVELEPVEPYLMVSCSLMPGTVVPPAREWTADTAPALRESMAQVVADWHPALRGIVERIELESMFSIPFGRLDPAPPWEPSRVTLAGDAAHAMLPTLGMGANLSLRDAGALCARLVGGGDVVEAIGAYEAEMRDVAYPLMRMAAEHDKHFGGGGLQADPQHV
jgi:2-polyprenyl-6-methoxyphenol hydroxylase-like FAD-dependent oxidoreductase